MLLMDVVVTSSNSPLKAEQLAQALSLPCLKETKADQIAVIVNEDRILLKHPLMKKPFLLNWDTVATKLAKDYKKHMLIKATGLLKQTGTVIDMTAGLGYDALCLAFAAKSLTLLERNPLMYVLLKDAYDHFNKHLFKVCPIELFNIDGKIWLEKYAMNNPPDVIYLDPMYPKRTKSSLVKKDMQLVKAIVGEDNDMDEIFLRSLQLCKQRVVVKRPIHAKYLADKKPDYQYRGRICRYDVYGPI